MKFFIVPAVSALLLAGLPAQANASAQAYLQLAAKKPDRAHPAGAQPSPAVVPAGQAHDGGMGHKRGTSTTGGAATMGGSGGAGGGAATTGGGHTVGGGATTGGGAAGGVFTGGAHGGTGGSAGGTATGGTGKPAGGGQMGGSTGGRNRGGAATGGIDRTGGGILLPGTPTGGHGTGGAVTGGAHAGGTVFGTRPQNWNRYPRTFDRRVYQRNSTASRRFHWQTYRRPHGWYFRRWVFGQVLPSIFWTNDYWLNDYWMFDLPVPPYGYVWVRYGDDALLVNRRTGQVLQVVYGLFD